MCIAEYLMNLTSDSQNTGTETENGDVGGSQVHDGIIPTPPSSDELLNYFRSTYIYRTTTLTIWYFRLLEFKSRA